MIWKREHLGLPLAPEKPSEYCYKAGELLLSRRDLNWSHNITLGSHREASDFRDIHKLLNLSAPQS